MKYKVKVTVIDKKLYPELQKEFCTNKVLERALIERLDEE